MIYKKLIFGLFFILSLTGCMQSSALLGPAYTLGSTGSALQAGLSYGSSEAVMYMTGKTPSENVKEFVESNSNIKIENKNDAKINEDFLNLVKSSLEKTSSIINLSNQ